MSSNNNPNKYNFFQPLIIGLAAAIGLISGYNMNFQNGDFTLIDQIDTNQEAYKLGKIEEILRFVETNYVDDIEENNLVENAIVEVLNNLDPHSDYISPDYLKAHNERMEGEYTGIGVEMIRIDDVYYISHVQADGPAKAASIKVGDAILKINDKLVSGNETPFVEVRKLMRQEEGQTLNLTIKGNDSSTETITDVGVSKISISSADKSYMVDDHTGYIKISRFSSNTYNQFMQSVEAMFEKKEDLNLIIDLRNNPGGYLPQAIKILCQIFMEKDKLLTFTKGEHRKKAEYRTTGKRFFNIKKVAILMNGYSASGSEVIAGAIQDWDRGVIIGEESYGKGLVQEIYSLKNGGALRLTVAKYYTPSGRLIQKPYTTLNGNINTDTTGFKTKLLERRVPGGGGIIPDYEVFDIDYNECRPFLDFIDEFVMHELVVEKKPLDPDREDFILKFTEYVYNNYQKQYVQGDICNQFMVDNIKAEIMRKMGKENKSLQKVNEHDQSIQEAADLFSRKKSIIALLSDKS